MDQKNTVFYLKPRNQYALAIVEDSRNTARRCKDPQGAEARCLRIGLDQRPNNPPWLASFGRRNDDDVILGRSSSKNGQCYFDFNPETGELLVHDISYNCNTQLYEVEYDIRKGRFKEYGGKPQMLSARPRQCAVLLTRDCRWIFQMHNAEFLLVSPPRPAQDEDEFAKKKMEFADQFATNATQGMTELTSRCSQPSETLGTNSLPSTVVFHSYNLRYKGPHQPEGNEVIRYTRLGFLGVGGQGEVHKVVNMHDGSHYACKTIAVKANVPQLKVQSEAAFRELVEREVDLVKKVHHHENIVHYLYTQGFKFGQDIEIFMPIYEGSLQELLEAVRPQKPEIIGLQDLSQNGLAVISEKVQNMTAGMLRQILDALNFVHTYQPQIIHGDVKPGNILYEGSKFLLTDFGLAQVAEMPQMRAGTAWYMAPELCHDGDRTPKVDIYALGVTVAECLFKLPLVHERNMLKEGWREALCGLLGVHAGHYTSMLAEDPQSRPTAQEIADSLNLRLIAQDSSDALTQASMQCPQSNTTGLSPGVLPSTNPGTTTRHPDKMEWKYTYAESASHGASSSNSSIAMGASSFGY